MHLILLIVTPPEPPNGDLSAGAVAGIAVAAVVVALIAVVLIVIIIIYKLKKGTFSNMYIP